VSQVCQCFLRRSSSQNVLTRGSSSSSRTTETWWSFKDVLLPKPNIFLYFL
jgi:hypothetical protein